MKPQAAPKPSHPRPPGDPRVLARARVQAGRLSTSQALWFGALRRSLATMGPPPPMPAPAVFERWMSEPAFRRTLRRIERAVGQRRELLVHLAGLAAAGQLLAATRGDAHAPRLDAAARRALGETIRLARTASPISAVRTASTPEPTSPFAVDGETDALVARLTQ